MFRKLRCREFVQRYYSVQRIIRKTIANNWENNLFLPTIFQLLKNENTSESQYLLKMTKMRLNELCFSRRDFSSREHLLHRAFFAKKSLREYNKNTSRAQSILEKLYLGVREKQQNAVMEKLSSLQSGMANFYGETESQSPLFYYFYFSNVTQLEKIYSFF